MSKTEFLTFLTDLQHRYDIACSIRFAGCSRDSQGRYRATSDDFVFEKTLYSEGELISDPDYSCKEIVKVNCLADNIADFRYKLLEFYIISDVDIGEISIDTDGNKTCCLYITPCYISVYKAILAWVDSRSYRRVKVGFDAQAPVFFASRRAKQLARLNPGLDALSLEALIRDDFIGLEVDFIGGKYVSKYDGLRPYRTYTNSFLS